MATFLRRIQYEGGPPPSVDWWLTRVNAASKPAMRYWDGTQWSVAIPADAREYTVAERQVLAREKCAYPQEAVRWTRFKPQWWLAGRRSGKTVQEKQS